ncbi:uncharacterized protein PAC_07696 [Phialocephala subalpina]|uniref:Uncharacterized protein n=1 Tax=Phialocephala subalpina TaxID=576137 RepID=A0A1L7WYG4_9HELO|nr:uncharacterized protein PAC_07696 [Phialocephala subalpina]
MHYSLLTSIAVLALSPLVSADCTNFTNVRWLSDDAYDFSNEFEQVVEILACPKADNKTCTFTRKTYDLTIPRELNISASAADVDNIFYLASQAYGAWPANYTRDPFITRNTTVSTLNSRMVSDTLLEVEPGKNSLNGVGVRAAAPYLTNDTNNNTVVAGNWGAVTGNITGESAAGTLKGNGMNAAFVGLGTVLFAFVL